MKSFRPRAEAAPPEDEGPGDPSMRRTAADAQPTRSETPPMPSPKPSTRNAEVDFRGERRLNATHASTTDPDARLYKKSPGTGAMLCFIGHALMENRSGLIVQADLTGASGRAERRAALDMIHRHDPGSTRRLTLGADKGYDTAEFIADLRQACVTPHVAEAGPVIPRSTGAPPGTKAMRCRSGIASGSKRLLAGPGPSAGARRPYSAASSASGRASS